MRACGWKVIEDSPSVAIQFNNTYISISLEKRGIRIQTYEMLGPDYMGKLIEAKIFKYKKRDKPFDDMSEARQFVDENGTINDLKYVPVEKLFDSKSIPASINDCRLLITGKKKKVDKK